MEKRREDFAKNTTLRSVGNSRRGFASEAARRERKDALLMQKRMVLSRTTDEDFDADLPSVSPVGAALVDDAAAVIQAILGLYSHDINLCRQSARYFRAILSSDSHAPIDQVFQAGIAPQLVQLALNSNDMHTRADAVACLTNLTAGRREHSHTLIQSGVLPAFARALGSGHVHMMHHTACALGNIALDSPTNAAAVLSYPLLHPLLATLMAPTPDAPWTKSVLWAVSVLVRAAESHSCQQEVRKAVNFILDAIATQDIPAASRFANCLSALVTDAGWNHTGFAPSATVIQRLAELCCHDQLPIRLSGLTCMTRLVSVFPPVRHTACFTSTGKAFLRSLAVSMGCKESLQLGCELIQALTKDSVALQQIAQTVGLTQGIARHIASPDLDARLDALNALRQLIRCIPADVQQTRLLDDSVALALCHLLSSDESDDVHAAVFVLDEIFAVFGPSAPESQSITRCILHVGGADSLRRVLLHPHANTDVIESLHRVMGSLPMNAQSVFSPEVEYDMEDFAGMPNSDASIASMDPFFDL